MFVPVTNALQHVSLMLVERAGYQAYVVEQWDMAVTSVGCAEVG